MNKSDSMNVTNSRIWDQFPQIASVIKNKHEEVGLHGHHDFVHAFRVGDVARQIALDEWRDERISQYAGLAGMSHNADRIIQKEEGIGRKDVPVEKIKALVKSWLQNVFDDQEIAEVSEAITDHDGLNNPHDSKVLIALMDADRVVNLDIDLFPRSGQFYSELPVVDYKHFPNSDPEANYRDPKSVLYDINCSLDWVAPNGKVCVRTRLGRQMAEERAEMFYLFNKKLKEQLEQEGVLPYPFK